MSDTEDDSKELQEWLEAADDLRFFDYKRPHAPVYRWASLTYQNCEGWSTSEGFHAAHFERYACAPFVTIIPLKIHTVLDLAVDGCAVSGLDLQAWGPSDDVQRQP